MSYVQPCAILLPHTLPPTRSLHPSMLRCSILPILVCLTAWFLGALAMPIDAPLALQLGVRHIAGDSPLVLRGENTPLAPGRRDVWVPKIEVPTGTTVWHRGHVVTVEWYAFEGTCSVLPG